METDGARHGEPAVDHLPGQPAPSSGRKPRLLLPPGCPYHSSRHCGKMERRAACRHESVVALPVPSSTLDRLRQAAGGQHAQMLQQAWDIVWWTKPHGRQAAQRMGPNGGVADGSLATGRGWSRRKARHLLLLTADASQWLTATPMEPAAHAGCGRRERARRRAGDPEDVARALCVASAGARHPGWFRIIRSATPFPSADSEEVIITPSMYEGQVIEGGRSLQPAVLEQAPPASDSAYWAHWTIFAPSQARLSSPAALRRHPPQSDGGSRTAVDQL